MTNRSRFLKNSPLIADGFIDAPLISNANHFSGASDVMPKTFAFDAEPPVTPDANGMYACAIPSVTKYFF